ncbi:MAG: PhzF family phenazine biosynthesis isomerase [Pirellulaceae bacterium]|nr:PhzF family phenazine biosynthesis isomerase [Pirellulaceae bacterium]
MRGAIRAMRLDDYPRVRELWEAAAGVGLDESDDLAGITLYLERNPQLSLVAEDGGQIVGAVLCGHDGRRGYLSHLAVAEGYRRAGLGRQLVERCLNQLFLAGLRKCNVRIFGHNHGGLEFWRAMGWKERDDLQVLTIYADPAARRQDPRANYWSEPADTARQASSVPLYQVDAFTSRPFSGNPAAVCLLDHPADDAWMQAVAAEMNLSETAFVLRSASGSSGEPHGLRWFTPRVEVDLCGHATLAAAHVLWQQGWAGREDTLRFHSRSGELRAERRGEWIELDFPALSVREAPAPPGLLAALGVDPLFVGRCGLSPDQDRGDYLVHVQSPAEVARLAPDFTALARIAMRGAIVTSQSDSDGCDFVSRFFAPACGVNEDPVTGSAHCGLGPYWRQRLGRDELTGRQLSERGGEVRVRVAGERVLLGGQAVTVFSGRLSGTPRTFRT